MTPALSGPADPVSPAPVYESESTRVFRLPECPGIVCKQPLGRGAGERLRQERDVLTQLAHIEGVARIDDTVEVAGALVLRDGGETLAALLAAGRMERLPSIALACELARTLAKVHGSGFIHRDINPSNILRGADGHCTLIDFGSALAASQEGAAAEGADRAGGSLAYIAPEQTGRTGRAMDHRADLYSLGVVLYEMVLGRKPFDRTDALELMHAHLVERPVAPLDVDPALAPPLSDIILRLLEKDPARRYQGAEGLAHDLERVRQAMSRNEACSFTIGDHDFGARLVPPERTVGREAELAALGALLQAPLHEMEPCVLLAGPGGVGKTRLVNEVKALAAGRQEWFVSATFRPHRRDAISAAAPLRSLARLLLAEPEEQLAVYRERMRKAVGSNLGLGVTRFPEFELLLGKHDPPAIADPREAEARVNQSTLDLLRSVTSCGRRVVMVLEDLQWAPSITLAFLDAVVSSPTPLAGLLVVGTYRTEDVGAGHPLLALFERWRGMRTMPAQLEVTPLPAAALAQMVALMLRETPVRVGALAGALHDRTGGNPHDAVELVNALRQEGMLRRHEGSWQWDAAQVRAYVGECSVPLLLARRVARLTAESRSLLECLACLGGAVRVPVLAAAAGVAGALLRERLVPAVEDGLLVLQDGDLGVVRFRHPRVQQTVLDAMAPEHRTRQHLGLARRLVGQPDLAPLAAEQYLPATALIEREEERLQVARLFQEAARETGTFHLSVSDRYLACAMALLAGTRDAASARYLELAAARHRVLYAMGQLEEADTLYALLADSVRDPVQLAPVARVQMYSLSNRAEYREALALGLDLLAALGVQRPSDHRAAIRAGFERVAEWYRSEARLADFHRPLVSEPGLLATASLISGALTAAYFCDAATFSWIALEAHRMWSTHGPCDGLMHGAAAAVSLLSGIPQDHRGAHAGMRHLIAVGEARGLATGTAVARFTSCITVAHWVDPIEEVAVAFRTAREELMRAGDSRLASYTFLAADLLLDCAPTLHEAAADVDAGHAFATSIGNADYIQRYLPRRQLLRALQGRTSAPGGFDDQDFDEGAYVRGLGGADSTSAATFHMVKTIGAALFADTAAWARHSASALPLLVRTPGYYLTAVLRTLHGVALAEKARSGDAAERSQALAELQETHVPWLRQRAENAPANFLHLLRWLEAELAWSTDTLWNAGAAFDRALEEAGMQHRPWHFALVTERAALFHLAHGLEATGRSLLARACDRYDAWGAQGKVREMERTHPSLRARTSLPADQAVHRQAAAVGADADADAMDLMAIIRASQSLSSETDLEQLRRRVSELLGAITGATRVTLALWQEEAGGWMLPEPGGQGEARWIPIEESGAAGLVPLAAVRYAERTRQALLVNDACRDARFSEDPYFTALESCSLLVVPILNQGVHRAMLLLENNCAPGAFSAERLDSVTLIGGQLAVSLENALLYRQLEERVEERTRQLRAAQAELVATARRAGMAEIATNVLHNVGNVLNSVNVSSSLVAAKLRSSRIKGLPKAVQMMQEHREDLGSFLTADEKGRLLPAYLASLAEAVTAEHDEMRAELEHLMRSVDHIKAVVATQQSHAGVSSSVIESTDVRTLVEDALRINSIELERLGVEVQREFDAVPLLQLDKTRVMQILVNLVRNSAQALAQVKSSRHLQVRIACQDAAVGIRVTDTGVGIAGENLTRIFGHGFTTRVGGHGFGLHSSALAARQMGGTLVASSEGVGRGASFCLELPMAPAAAAAPGARRDGAH